MHPRRHSPARHIISCFIFISVFLTPIVVSAAKVGYDWGFYLADDDFNYKFVWGGGVIPKFQYRHSRSSPLVTSFSLGAYTTLKAEFFKQAKLEFTIGHGTGMPDYATANVGNAIGEWRIIPEFVITMGTVGLSLDLGCDYGWMLLNDPPLTRTQGAGVNDGVPNGRVTPLRSSFGAPGGLGLRLSGYYYKFYYSVSAINGNESAFLTNPDRRFSFGGRFRYDILGGADWDKETDYDFHEKPAVAVNIGSIYQGKRTDPFTNADVKYWWTSSLGAGFRYRGLAITSEAYYRRTKILNVGNATWARPVLTDFGYYGAVGYYVLPKKFEVAAVGGQIFRQGPDNDSYEFGGGLNYYIYGFNGKVQLSYKFGMDFDDVAGTQNNHIHTVDLSYAVRF